MVDILRNVAGNLLEEGNGTTTGTSPNCLEIGCAAIGNGLTGSGGSSDNASTAHDQCNVIRVNCVYVNSADRALIDIDNAHSWNLGLFVGQSVTGNTGGESIVVGGGVSGTASKMWIDSCFAPSGSFSRWASITPTAGSAALNYFNSGAVVNSGSNTGSVTAYAA